MGNCSEDVEGNCKREGIPEWLEDFADNLELAEEFAIKVASRKHSIYIHFPEDQICKVCKRTKITMALCRTRTGNSVRRAEKFGDLITVDHRIFNEGIEPRHNHRYSVVVQDSAIQWIQSYLCGTKTSQETENSPEFGKACEDLYDERFPPFNFISTQKVLSLFSCFIARIGRVRQTARWIS